MSGITGIFHFDGRPVNPEILKQMTDVASHRGPDGSGYWCAGPVGLDRFGRVGSQPLQPAGPALSAVAFPGRDVREQSSDLSGPGNLTRVGANSEDPLKRRG